MFILRGIFFSVSFFLDNDYDEINFSLIFICLENFFSQNSHFTTGKIIRIPKITLIIKAGLTYL